MTQKSARQVLLDALARREHSRAELREKLLLREFGEEEITSLLDEFISLGYQSDHRFAHSYTSMRANRGFGPVRICQELKKREVDAGLINAALGTVEWEALVKIARQKRFGLELPETAQERAQQMRFLQYRGFTTEQIKVAVFDECYI